MGRSYCVLCFLFLFTSLKKPEKEANMKSWILQYAELSSDEDVPSNWDDNVGNTLDTVSKKYKFC